MPQMTSKRLVRIVVELEVDSIQDVPFEVAKMETLLEGLERPGARIAGVVSLKAGTPAEVSKAIH